MNPARLSRSLRLVAALVLVATVAACGSSSSASGANSGFAGIVREPVPDVSAISLPSADTAQTPTPCRAQPHGLLIAYFGYLSCSDVCPTTMADLRTALSGLSATDQTKVDVVMTTIDPARDTAEAFGADYQVDTNASGAVEVAHTAHVYVVDDQGRVRLTWAFGTLATDMRGDLKRLLALTAGEA